MSRSWKSTTRRHGTKSGWNLHIELKEQPCDLCLAAKRKYEHTRLAAPYNALMNRLHARAQTMTNSQMRHNHPEEYKNLYEANKAKLLIERADELERAKTINSQVLHVF